MTFKLRLANACWVQLLLQIKVPFPDGIDSRIDTQLHDKGREDAADHGGGNTLHGVGARAR